MPELERLDKIVGLENFCADIHFTDEPYEECFDPHDDGNELLTDEGQKLGDQLLPYLPEQAKKKKDEEKLLNGGFYLIAKENPFYLYIKNISVNIIAIINVPE